MNKVSLKDTFGLIRADYANWLRVHRRQRSNGIFFKFLFFPGTIAVNIHRFAHYFYCKNWLFFSRSLYLFNVFLTGTEFGPRSRIGGGFVLFHPVGSAIVANIGENVIMSGQIGIGSGGTKKDIGAGPGLPVIGNNVKIGPKVLILGAIKIGDGVNIKAFTGVFRDMPDNTLVGGNPAEAIKNIPSDYNIFRR